MVYELWDVEIGNCLAHYADEREMATLVHALVSQHGPSTADDLTLTIEDDLGTESELLDGERLIAWAEAALGYEGDPARSGFIASGIRAVRSRVHDLAGPSRRHPR